MKQTVFINGKFIPEEEATVSIKTHALHYGTGIFEGIRAYYDEKEKALFAFRLHDHFKRMHQSAKLLFIRIPYTPEELCDITKKLLQKNFTPTDIYIRPIAFKSAHAVGNFNLSTLEDSFSIYTVPMGRHINTTDGVRANISTWKRISDNAIPPRAKITGAYINTSLAKTESLLNGYDEALFLDEQGHIVEGSAENIFLVKDGHIITPPASEDILIGITRDTIMQLITHELNMPVIERSIDRSEAYQADEIFLVGTGAEVGGVIDIDKRPIGEGKVGKTTRKLQSLYHDLVHGKNKKYMYFLTRIDSISATKDTV
jgi:branched-chain amino acid aminotransferase